MCVVHGVVVLVWFVLVGFVLVVFVLAVAVVVNAVVVLAVGSGRRGCDPGHIDAVLPRCLCAFGIARCTLAPSARHATQEVHMPKPTRRRRKPEARRNGDHHLNGRDQLAPIEAPELTILAALDHILDLATLPLGAAHPELASGGSRQ